MKFLKLWKKEEYIFNLMKLLEAFTSGTAVNIGPVKGLYYHDKLYKLPEYDLGAGPYSLKIHKQIEDIQVLFSNLRIVWRGRSPLDH